MKTFIKVMALPLASIAALIWFVILPLVTFVQHALIVVAR